MASRAVAKCGAWRHAPWPSAGPPPTAGVRVSETLTPAVGGGPGQRSYPRIDRARRASIERSSIACGRIAVPRRVVGSKKILSVLLYTSAQTGLLPSWPAQGPQNSPSSRRRSRTPLPWWIPPVGGRGGVCRPCPAAPATVVSTAGPVVSC